MSIATELQNYNDGLLAAYNAVNTKGGTVPANKNLDNLPTAISSISGGAAKEATDWGRIYFYKFGLGLSEEEPSNCEVTNLDAETLVGYLNNNYSWGITTGKDLLYLQVTGEFQTDTWFVQCNYNNDETGVYLSTNWSGDGTSLENDLGISVTIEDPEYDYAFFEEYWDYVVDTTSSINSLELSETEFKDLGYNTANLQYAKAMGAQIPNGAIYGFDFGTETTAIPNNCLNGCRNLEEIDFSFATQIVQIGDYFLHGAQKFNSDMTLPNTITTIGDGFLGSCIRFNSRMTLPNAISSIGKDFMEGNSAFNQDLVIPNSVSVLKEGFFRGNGEFNSSLTLPNSLTKIENFFLQNNTKFNQPLVIPSTVTSIGRYFLSMCYAFSQHITIPSGCSIDLYSFMYNCNGVTALTVNSAVSSGDNFSLSTNQSGAAMYQTGVTIYGTQRASWLSNLPNRTSQPYRKLVDGGA